MTLFRTGLLSGGVAFFSEAAEAQQNVGAAGTIVTLQMPVIPERARVTRCPALPGGGAL